MGKKRTKTKPVEVKLPVIPGVGCPTPEILVVPTFVEPDKVPPLAAPVGPVRCIAKLWEPFIGSPYVILVAAEGNTLPKISEEGEVVDVQFSPPQ